MAIRRWGGLALIVGPLVTAACSAGDGYSTAETALLPPTETTAGDGDGDGGDGSEVGDGSDASGDAGGAGVEGSGGESEAGPTGEAGETQGGSQGDGDGDPTMSAGDGDGDPTMSAGDGDGDPSASAGDGDGDPSATATASASAGDGDGDPSASASAGDGDGSAGDGDGDTAATLPTDAGTLPTVGDGDGDGDDWFDGFEDGPPLASHWNVASAGDWEVSPSNPETGLFSAMSNTGVPNGAFNLTLTLNYDAPGTIAFDYYFNTDPLSDDNFTFFVNDGPAFGPAGGDMGPNYQHIEVAIPSAGAYTFRWEYAKDALDLNVTDDRVFIDNVTAVNGAP